MKNETLVSDLLLDTPCEPTGQGEGGKEGVSANLPFLSSMVTDSLAHFIKNLHWEGESGEKEKKKDSQPSSIHSAPEHRSLVCVEAQQKARKNIRDQGQRMLTAQASWSRIRVVSLCQYGEKQEANLFWRCL